MKSKSKELSPCAGIAFHVEIANKPILWPATSISDDYWAPMDSYENMQLNITRDDSAAEHYARRAGGCFKI